MTINTAHRQDTGSGQREMLATLKKQQLVIRRMEQKLLSLYQAALPLKGTGHPAIDQALTCVDEAVALTKETVRREALYDLLGAMNTPPEIVEQLKGTGWDHAADAIDARYIRYLDLAHSLVEDTVR